MNFKRKLWWAQHKNDVYKYGTIISLVLIVTISIIYFTYSKFSSSNEMTMYETTVEPFIKNDYFIASYIDGEWSNEIPGKDDGYVVDKIVCDNGATGTWDNEEWGINIRNATKKIKCSVYFIVPPVPIVEKITALATTDTTNFASDDPDNNIRYIGRDPNNYIYFNCSDYNNQSDSTCEKWRIIGVFKNMAKEDGTKEDLVKIIRDDSLEKIAWNSSGKNDWSTASLQTTLNDNYYNGTYTTGALKNDLTRNAIESVVWNLGELESPTGSKTGTFYSAERGTAVNSGHATTWLGKIALMYPSDYGYATAGGSATNRTACLKTTLDNWSGFNVSDCKNNNYLYKPDYTQWTLMSYLSKPAFVYLVFSSGGVDGYSRTTFAGYEYNVRPTLYLKSNVLIATGDGTSSNPYQLKLN